MLVDKCHLADIHKPTRRLKLTADDSKFSEDRLQALAWIADRMEEDCVVEFDPSTDRSMKVDDDKLNLCLCQTKNPGNCGGPINGGVLGGLTWFANRGLGASPEQLEFALTELEYGNTAPFSKYLIQK